MAPHGLRIWLLMLVFACFILISSWRSTKTVDPVLLPTFSTRHLSFRKQKHRLRHLRSAILSPYPSRSSTDRNINDTVWESESSFFREAYLQTPIHQIPAYSRQIELPRGSVRPQDLLYVVATNSDRAAEYIARLWPHFINPGEPQLSSPCFVLLPPNEVDQISTLKQKLADAGLHCFIKAGNIERYENRVLSLIKEAWQYSQAQSLGTKWYMFGDDDTFWIDSSAMLRMLSGYESNKNYFFGGFTESKYQLGVHGIQAFGGAGMILSAGIMKKMNSNGLYQKCFADTEKSGQDGYSLPGENINWLGGDGMITYCASLAKGVAFHDALDIMDGLRQLDIPALAAGLIQSGMPFLTLHHFIRAWCDIYPYQPENPNWPLRDQWKGIETFSKAVKYLGYDNFRRRYAFEGGRAILVNGYSLTIYATPLSQEQHRLVEYTWSYDDYTTIFPQRPRIFESADETRADPNTKTTFWFRDIFVDPEREGRALMLYETTLGRRILIEWNEYMALGGK